MLWTLAVLLLVLWVVGLLTAHTMGGLLHVLLVLALVVLVIRLVQSRRAPGGAGADEGKEKR
jgi:uncharacterized membrane protein